MKINGMTALAVAALVALAAVVFAADSGFAQGVPAPLVYHGTVTIAGQPAPDGYNIYAQIEDYRSQPVQTKNGRYTVLTVAPPAPTQFGARNPYTGKTINFYLENVQAAQTAEYNPSGFPLPTELNLTFPNLPVPTPAPTPIPTNTPVPTPTPILPTATATPSVAKAMTFVTAIIVARTGDVPEGAQLTARIGDDYTSEPVAIKADGNVYGLTVDPSDTSFIGQEIEFFLDGIKSLATRTTFESGAVVQEIALIFELPVIPTPEPTATPIPEPTATPEPPPTATPEPPTSTPAPPAADTPTPEPTIAVAPSPTNTPPPPPEPPTATPVPPATSTPVPEPTAAPEPEPTNTPIVRDAPSPPTPPEQAGGCSSVTDNLPFGTAAANLALLLAPLGLIGIRKLTIRRR